MYISNIVSGTTTFLVTGIGEIEEI